MFAVYDGHAGEEAVMVVKKTLPDSLRTHLQEERDVEEAIRVAFRNTDEELMKRVLAAAPKPEEVKVSSGTVAVTVPEDTLISSGFGAAAKTLQKLGVEVRGGYVGDHVAVSRAFGNVTYQSGEKVKGIINEPDVYKIEIDEEVDFLMLASDGIWDLDSIC